MGRQRLGEYLIEHGLATPTDVVRALEIQASRRTPLGEICIQEGVLNVADVLEVLNRQVGTPHERFGEIALSEGLLTKEQLNIVQIIQKIFTQPLGDVLAEIGVIDKDRLASIIEAFEAGKPPVNPTEAND